MTPDELRVVGTLHQTTAKTARGHRRLVTQEELDAAADAWDETEGRLFDSHGMVMDLRERLEAAEKAIDTSTWFYKNCKRQRRNAAKICQVCPFRAGIEVQEAALAGEVQP
jgi:hypothetical protein